MSCRPRPEGTGRAAVLLARGLLACGLARPSAEGAEERVRVGGLLDAEYWDTDAGSLLLSRNDGEAAPAGRLRLWAVAAFADAVQGFVLGGACPGSGWGRVRRAVASTGRPLSTRRSCRPR